MFLKLNYQINSGKDVDMSGLEGWQSAIRSGEIHQLPDNNATMTKEQMECRINLLSSEIDANEEENRVMQAEITALYQKIDTLKTSEKLIEERILP